MASSNARIADAFLRRSLDLERFFKGARRSTVAAIDALAKELQQLIYASDPTSPLAARYRELRIRRLLEKATVAIRAAYDEIGQVHREQQRLLAALEGRAALKAINEGSKFALAVVGLTREQITAVSSDAVIEGTPLKEWWARQAAKTTQRFADEMRKGFRSGETVGELVGRVRGRVFLDATRKGAEMLVRTSFQSVTQTARMMTFENNSDVVKAVAWRTTLDTRSCPQCAPLSGLQWTVPDFEPIDHDLPWRPPPIHPACRCSGLPVTKSWDELRGRRLQGGQGFAQTSVQTRFRESLRRKGFTPEQIERAMPNAQASMDGQVPEDLTFEDWLATKSESAQKEVLGPARWELWNNGDIELRDLLDDHGRILTLDQLAERT